MRPPLRDVSEAVRSSFRIVATRLKSELDADKTFYWFYVSLHLEQTPGASISLSEIELVEYHLLHHTFPNPNVRIVNRANGFEYRMWLYGFIEVSADLITKQAELVSLPPTKLSWPVEKDEIDRNGKSELSWD